MPFGVAVNPVTDRIYVSADSNLSVLGGSTNAIEANSLTSKLTNALSALQSPNGSDANTACNKLDAFINETQAQQQKQQLTATQVRELTTEAQLIKTALGCS